MNVAIYSTIREVASLARKGVFDHLIIESTGISEPMAVAETFTYDLSNDDKNNSSSTDTITSTSKVIELTDGEGGIAVSNALQSLMDIAEIDSMVTVVDAANFLHDLKEAEELAERFFASYTSVHTFLDLLYLMLFYCCSI